VTQPSFVPIPTSAEVRPSYATPVPEVNRPPKAGLLRHVPTSAGAGTPAPGGGFALTLAYRAVHDLELERPEDRHDLELAVAMVAAKRASHAGRGPTTGDVEAALRVLGADTAPVPAAATEALSGLAHSYVAQRALVDAVTDLELDPSEE
jgi:hypothetical protein